MDRDLPQCDVQRSTTAAIVKVYSCPFAVGGEYTFREKHVVVQAPPHGERDRKICGKPVNTSQSAVHLEHANSVAPTICLIIVQVQFGLRSSIHMGWFHTCMQPTTLVFNRSDRRVVVDPPEHRSTTA